MHASHVRAEGTIVEPSLTFFLAALCTRCAFARYRHTLTRRIIALADESSLNQGFTP
jgi:hypothetical protein